MQKGGESFQNVTKITNAIRAMGSSIDGFEDMEITVSIKFTLDKCGWGKEQQNWAENLSIIC